MSFISLGMKLILNAEIDEYAVDPSLAGEGIAIRIHSPDISGKMYLGKTNIQLPVGKSTSIGLRVVRTN